MRSIIRSAAVLLLAAAGLFAATDFASADRYPSGVPFPIAAQRASKGNSDDLAALGFREVGEIHILVDQTSE